MTALTCAEIIRRLKSNGFHWSRYIGAWQRHRGHYALQLAKEIAGSY